MRVVAPLVRTLVVAVVLLAVVDRVFVAAFPRFGRLRTTFSAAYLAREVRALASERPIVVLGDSVLWGYGVDADRSAVGIIAAHRRGWENLAYPGGSPANTLAMVRLLRAAGVRPRLVIFDVNPKVFNAQDSAYARLAPAVETLAWPLLTVSERADLVPTLSPGIDASLDRALGRYWATYGMRPDLRDAIFDASDAANRLRDVVRAVSGAGAEAAAAHRPTPAVFEGTYDLTPLSNDNVAYRALSALAASLRAERVPALAVLTPTNHALLREYIDNAAYRANLRSIRTVLERAGIRVLDLDASFRGDEFLDNDHLTIEGNARLARILARSADRIAP